MDFTIFSIGSSTFLTEVLNGVAMITGSGDIGKMASVGFLLFCMWTGVKYIMNPQQGVPWGQALAGYLMYAVMFGPAVTAYVEDVYTGRVTVTHNVPIGPVAAGSIMSQFGYGLTQLQEQGYGMASDTARLTEGGYMDPLKTLVGLRRQEIVDIALQGVDQNIGGNAKHTLFNYMRDCTMRKPSLQGQDSYDEITTGSLPDGLFLNNSFYTTEIYIGSGPQIKNCVQAQTDVIRIFERLENNTDIHQQITGVLRADKHDESIGRPDSIQNLEDFFNGFPEISASNAVALMQAGIALPLFQAAEAAHLKDGLDAEAAFAYNLALQERNAQWAAEGSSFLDTVRPFLAYVEGLSFAIAPLAAIIVIMGAAGIGLVGKYMMLFFWIQLWMPILSISNLYLIQAASDQFNTLAAGNSNFNMGSFYAFSVLSDIAENWVGVGAAMMAATPFISLFVVSGSIYTMNQLAGRMSSADSFDEGRVGAKGGAAPAAISEAPVFSFDHGGGTRLTGTEGTMAQISASSITRGATSVSRADAIQSSDQFASTLSQMAANQQTSGTTSRLTNSALESSSFTNSESFQNSQAVSSRVASSFGLSNQDTQRLSGQISTGLSLSPSLGGFGFGAKGDQTFQTASGETITADQVKQKLSQSGWSEDDQVALRGEFAESFGNALESSDTSQYSATQQNQLSSAASQLYSSSQTHQESKEQADAIDISASPRLNDVGYQLSKNQTAGRAVHELFNSNVAGNPLLANSAEQTRNNLVNNGVSPEAAETAGKFVALMRQSNWENENSQDFTSAFNSLGAAGAFSEVFGTNIGSPGLAPQTGPSGDPFGNSSLENEASQIGNHAPPTSFDPGRSGQIIQDAASGGPSGKTPEERFNAEKQGMVDQARQVLGENGVNAYRDLMNRAANGDIGTGPVSAASQAGSALSGLTSNLLQKLNIGNAGEARENVGRAMIQASEDPQAQLGEWINQHQAYTSGSLFGRVDGTAGAALQAVAGNMGDGGLGNVIQNYGSDEWKEAWNNLSTTEQAQAAYQYARLGTGHLWSAAQYGDGDAKVHAIAISDAPEALKNLQMAALVNQGGVSQEAQEQYNIPSYTTAREQVSDLVNYIDPANGDSDLETIERVVANQAASGSGGISSFHAIAQAMTAGANGRELSGGDGDIFTPGPSDGFGLPRTQ